MGKMAYLCVDFDGTLCKHVFPKIGDEVPHAFECLKKYQEAGLKIILFTMRSGDELLEAIEWCKTRGLIFYGINTNPTQKNWTSSPKAYGNLYIDDAAVGCPLIFEEGHREYVDWVEVDKIVINRVGGKLK